MQIWLHDLKKTSVEGTVRSALTQSITMTDLSRSFRHHILKAAFGVFRRTQKQLHFAEQILVICRGAPQKRGLLNGRFCSCCIKQLLCAPPALACVVVRHREFQVTFGREKGTARPPYAGQCLRFCYCADNAKTTITASSSKAMMSLRPSPLTSPI